jgi:hypothetical protein
MLLVEMEMAMAKTRMSRSYDNCTTIRHDDCVHEASSETDAEFLALSAADSRE